MIEVDIVTPTRQLAKGLKATSVTLPSSKGEIQILPQHRDLLTALGTGILSVVEDGRVRQFAISYGFAEIRNDKVIVLAETAEESTEIDKGRALRSKKRAEEIMGGVLTREEFAKQERKLQRALIRQQIAR
jgi:F-type H+-transporting ATPase subunit epsilon